MKMKEIDPENLTVYVYIIEFFSHSTKLTCLAFLYKTDIQGFTKFPQNGGLQWELNS